MKSSANSGTVAAAFSATRRTTIPQLPAIAVWISTKNRQPSAIVRKKRQATSQAASVRWLPRPETARSAPPTTARKAPSAGSFALAWPAGIRSSPPSWAVSCVTRSSSRRQPLEPGGSGLPQQLRRRAHVEARVARLDRDEEAVVARALEAGRIEHGVVVARQLVEREDAEHRADRPAEHGQLEGDGDVGRPGEERLAAEHRRVGDRVD